jgi:PAS domain S-box-containing protein
LLSRVSSFAYTNQEHKLIIKGDWAYPPYEFINEKGEADGFNVELIRAIMKELKMPYELTLDDWPTILHELEEGKIDLVPAMLYSKERAKKFKFGVVHSYVCFNAVCRKGTKLKQFKDLRNKRVIVEDGDFANELLKNAGFKVNIIQTKTLEEGLKLLSNGTGDIALCDNAIARTIILKYSYNNLDIFDLGLQPVEYCFASQNEELLQKVNQAFFKLKSNGTYDMLYNKWFASKSSDKRIHMLYIIVGIMLGAMFFSFLIVYILKRKIRKEKNKVKLESERYITLFENTVVGLEYYDKEGIIVDLNRADCDIFGIEDKEAFISSKYSIYTDTVLKGKIDKHNVQPYSGILQYDLRKDSENLFFKTTRNQIMYIQTRVFPIRDMEGNLTSIITTSVDITEQVEYQKTLEEYKLKMDLAIKSSQLLPWEYNCGTDVISMPYKDEYADSRPVKLQEFYHLVHPDMQEEAIQIMNKVLSGKNESFKLEVKYRYESTSPWMYAMVVGIPFKFDKEGKCIQYTGYRLDTTLWHNLSDKLLSSNELMNAIINKLYCSLTIKDIDDDLRYLMVNKRFEDIYNKCNTEIIGKTDEELFPEKSPIIQEYDRKAIEKGFYTSQEIDSENTKVWHYSRSTLTTNDGRNLLITIAWDITTGAMLEELEKAKDEAERADKLKSAFLANMSHEIRTPLNAIVGFSQLLSEAESEDERKEYIHIIQMNNELLLRLINDVLDLSKIESGMIELKKEIFDLSIAFDKTYTALKQRCSNPGVEFLERNPYPSCMVELDQNRLLQVINNFATNAIKCTQKGHIIMGYEYVDKGIRIYVEDTGIGIEKEKQARVFDRFEKLNSFAQGTGLGLSICKAIVEASNGKIGFKSEKGVGSTFWAWFPCNISV